MFAIRYRTSSYKFIFIVNVCKHGPHCESEICQNVKVMGGVHYIHYALLPLGLTKMTTYY